MKALVLDGGFGFDNLKLIDRPAPAPGPTEVLVRVRAASLNYRDLLIVRGDYNRGLALPRVLGSDAAGEVVAVGAGVTKYAPGDRVAGCFFPGWADGPISAEAVRGALGSDRDGVFAEVAALDQDAVVRAPNGLSFEEAATLPCAALTAWNALHAGGCGPGATVLLLGTGGVSTFALQFAKALGARVLVASGSDEKLARAAALGADAGVNYRSVPDWDRWARGQTGGRGVDIVVEVGGAGTLERSAKAARYGGFIALIGVLAGGAGFNPIHVLMKALRLHGVFVGSREMFEAMNWFIEAEGLRPVVDHAVPLAQAAAALRDFGAGSHFGKVVLRME